MFRRLFSRDDQARHRASTPSVEAWSSEGRLEVAVRNTDSQTAVTPRLVLRIASTETSEYDRVELELESIEPGGRGLATVPTDRKSVYRVWWFLTWVAAGAPQTAAGNTDIT